jgi:sec-independent protein translocase protein TatB
MFDIGFGEIIIIAVIGLLVFGPDRLPKAAADGAKWLRQIRGMASGARQDLADSAGVDLSDAVDTVKELRDLHPKRLAASLLDDSNEDGAKKQSSAPAKDSGGPASPDTSAGPAFDPDAT